MKTLKQIESYLDKQCNVLLFSDSDDDITVVKLYQEHGKRAGALCYAALDFIKDNNFSAALKEGVACYKKAANLSKRKEKAQIVLNAVFDAESWLAWNHTITKPWKIKLGNLKPAEWLSLGNMLIYLAIPTTNIDTLNNCERLGLMGAQECFDKIRNIK